LPAKTGGSKLEPECKASLAGRLHYRVSRATERRPFVRILLTVSVFHRSSLNAIDPRVTVGIGSMPRVVFTSNLKRHVDTPDVEVDGDCVWQVLEAVFASNPHLRGYVLDEHNRLRTHMVIFVDGQPVKDLERLRDPVRPGDEVYVMQALSGG
jgi:molybdopterin synthase sulfur carrier subunit